MQLHHGEDTYPFKNLEVIFILKQLRFFKFSDVVGRLSKHTTIQFGFLVFLSHLKRVCKLKDIAAGLQKFAVIITVDAYHLQKPSGWKSCA